MKTTIVILATIYASLVSTCVCANQFDPMAPPGYGPVSTSNKVEKKAAKKYYYNLRQVVISEQGNRAVINGYVLKEGQYINKAKVVKIEKNKVTLSKAGELSVLRITHPINKVRR